MQRAPLALGALGLLDLTLLGVSQHVDSVRSDAIPPALVLAVALACVVALGSAPLADPDWGGALKAAVNAAGLVGVVCAVFLPTIYLVVFWTGMTLAEHWSRSLSRMLGNFLLHVAAGILAYTAFAQVMGGASIHDLKRASAACLCAGVVASLVTAVLVSLLVRYVDGVPFRQQPIWQPRHYARAQAFDLLGSLAAFLLLVSPWSLLFLGGPQLLLAGLLLKDAGSSAAAEQDAKTGLLNHPAFVSRARAELGRAARHADPVSLLVLDLDHLRDINNQHGHPVGDLAIAAVADVLRGTLRAHDLAARVGGEEFLVLLPCTDLHGALEVAERIRGSLTATALPARSAEVVVTASVGVAQVEAGEGWESLYERADQALLAAKRAGRDRVEPARAMALE